MIAFLVAFCTEHWFWGPLVATAMTGMFLQLAGSGYRCSLQFIVEIVHGHPPAPIVHHHADHDEEEV